MRLRKHIRIIVPILLTLCVAIAVALHAQTPAGMPTQPASQPTSVGNAEQPAETPSPSEPATDSSNPAASVARDAESTQANEPASTTPAPETSASEPAASEGASPVREEIQRQALAAIPHVERPKVASNAAYEPGVVLVTVREGTTPEQLLQAMATAGVKSVERNDIEAVTDDLMMAKLAPNATIDDAIYELESTGVAKGAQPNYLYEIVGEQASASDGTESAAEPALEETAATSEDKTTGSTDAPKATNAPNLAAESTAQPEAQPTAQPEAQPAQTDDQPATTAQSTSSTAARDSLNDPHANKQWDLDSIDALDAWEFPPVKNATATVGVGIVDNGFNNFHEDLADNVQSTYNATTRESAPVYCPPGTPTVEHGMHVAGIVAATSNNGKGIGGVGFNHLKLSLVSLTSESDPTGISAGDVAAGFEYLMKNKNQYNIRVANMSIGGKTPSLPDANDDVILKKIDEAYAAGIVTVASAGNRTRYAEPPYINYPSDYDTVVSVINLQNTNSDDPKSVERRDGSNYNDKDETSKNISAPGTNIYSTYPSGYGEMSGTSMAAPHVAGVVGLMFTVNPNMTTTQAKNLLYSSARDIGEKGWDEQFGCGEVNASDAVRAAAAGTISGPEYLAAGSNATYTLGAKYTGWSFSSSSPSVLTVDSNGNATAVSAGIANVVASSGNSSISQRVTVFGPITGNSLVAKNGSEALVITTPDECGALSWEWESSSDSVATVTNNGVVHGKGAGNTTITATLASNSSVSLSYDITVYDALKTDVYVPKGGTAALTPDASGFTSPQMVWSSTNEQVATVDSAGKVTAKSVGGTVVSCTITEGSKTATNVWCVYVYGPIEGDSQVGIGQSTQLKVAGINNMPQDLQSGWTWSLGAGSSSEVATVSESGVVTGQAPGTVIVTATRGQMSFSREMQVTQATPISLANAKVSIPRQTYSGQKLTPVPVVTLNGVTLAAGVDYEVVDQNIVGAGSHTVTIQGKGSYQGTATGVFVVEPKKLTPPKAKTGLVYNGQLQTGVPEGADYTLRNATGVDADSYFSTVEVKDKANTYWEDDGEDNSIVYRTSCRIEWSIAPRSASEVSVAIPGSYVYNGSAQTPKPTVTWNGEALDSDDYTVSFANNVNAGTATVTITCEDGNFKGARTATFKIAPASLNGATITGLSTCLYSGKFQTPKPTVMLAGKVLCEGIDYTLTYKNNLDVGTATVIVTGKGNYAGAKAATFKIESPPCAVTYRSHVQNVGWQNWVRNGALSGTSGRGLRLEGINLKLDGQPCAGSIEYRSHAQNVGWEDAWRRDGAMSGTAGRGLRLEAIQIRLTGQMAEHYDVWYRAHAQNVGWMGWTKNGERAGTTTYGYRLEGLEVLVLKKGAAAPGATANAYRQHLVGYSAHVQNVGWQGQVTDGVVGGTVGRSLRLEGMRIGLQQQPYAGGIEYRAHVQNLGWQGWARNGALSGTSGRGLRLEAIQIRLTGQMAERYDVRYRAHVQNIGWMDWVRNGEVAGTTGRSYRLEAIQVQLVPKV